MTTPNRKNLRRSSTNTNSPSLSSPSLRDSRQQNLIKRYGSILESDIFSKTEKPKKNDDKEEEIEYDDEEDEMTFGKRKRKRLSKADRRKYTTSLQQVMHDVMTTEGDVNFFTVKAGPSSMPIRNFCSVCGFESSYGCKECKSNYCSLKCLKIHKDTRCLKFLA